VHTPDTSVQLRIPAWRRRLSRMRANGSRALALWFGAMVLAVAAVQLALAQPEFRCAPLLPSASRSPPYTRVAGEDRCEGYFDQTVSQPFVELLSLTRHRPDAQPPAASQPLQIRLRSGMAAQLVIQPVRPSPFYRVDARLASDRALAWDAAPMLASTGLRLSDLGFLARAASPEPGTLAVVPVSLPPAIDEAAMAYAVLRVSVPVTSIAARHYRLGAGAAASGAWRELPGAPLYAWDSIVLPLELASDGLDTRVDVHAVGADGRLLPLLQFVLVGH
jgi:hypothetical protein